MVPPGDREGTGDGGPPGTAGCCVPGFVQGAWGAAGGPRWGCECPSWALPRPPWGSWALCDPPSAISRVTCRSGKELPLASAAPHRGLWGSLLAGAWHRAAGRLAVPQQGEAPRGARPPCPPLSFLLPSRHAEGFES